MTFDPQGVANLLCRAEHFPKPCPILPRPFGRGFFVNGPSKKMIGSRG